MPKRQITGAKLLTTERLMATLNMTEDQIMTLVKNGIPHIKRDEPGIGVYYLFPDREVLALVKPLPVPVVETQVNEEEDERIETIRPKPRMESTAPPPAVPDAPVEEVPADSKPTTDKPKAPKKPKTPAKPKTTAKPKK